VFSRPVCLFALAMASVGGVPRLSAQFGPDALGGPEVTPDGGTTAVPYYTFGNSVIFGVLNNSSITATYPLSCSSTSSVTCESVAPTSVTLAPGAETEVEVTFAATTGFKQRITLQAGASDMGYYNVTLGAPVGVSVTPDLGPIQQVANASGYTQVFTVTNTSTSSKTYNLLHLSRGHVTTTGVSPATLTLAAGASGTATVTYSTGSLGSGKAILSATALGAKDQGSANVTIVNTAPSVTLVVPTGTTRALVRTRQPVLRATFLRSSDVLDTAGTVLKWRGETVTALARQSRGLIEWEVDSTRWLAVGDSALAEATACTLNGPCTTVTRWVVLANDQKPVLGFSGTPLETLGGGFSAPFGPGFAVSGAEVETSISIPSYVSLGAPRSAGLVYSTRQSYPRVLVPIDVELPWPAGTPSQLAVRLFDGAVKLDSLVLASPTCATGAVKRCRTVLQGDFSASTFAVPTRKWLTVEVAVTSAGVTKAGTDSVEVVLVDRRATRYGSGWWPSGVLQLVGAGGDRILVGASGAATVYRGQGDSLYIPPPGNFTVLKKTTTGWELSPRGSLATLVFDASGRLVKSIDQNGNFGSVAYTGATDEVATFIDPVGKSITLSYVSGKLATFTDPGGRQSKITINTTTNQLTEDSVSSPQARGNRTVFAYQAYPGTKTVLLFQRVGVITDTTRVTYDSTFKRRPVQVRLPQVKDETGATVNPLVSYTAYERQGFGSLRSLDSVYVEMKDPRNNWTRSLLNRWGQARTTWDALGLIGKTEYESDGLVRWSEGKNGDSSRVYHDYDGLRRLARSWITRGGNVLRLDSLVYDGNHRVVKRIDARGMVDSLKYDTRGNLIESRDPAGNVTKIWYRASDGVVDSSRAPGETKSTRFTYETTWKNLSQVTDPSSTVLAINAYDNLGRVATSDRKVRVERTSTVTQWQWRRVQPFYNVAGQTDSTVYFRTLKCPDPCNTPGFPPPSSSLVTRVISVFDRAGRDSLRINRQGSTMLSLYDRLGRVLSQRPWTDSAAVKDSMLYDVTGNLKKVITRRGDQITMTYDVRNRDSVTVIPGVGTLRKLFAGPQDQLTRLWYDAPTDSIGGVNGELRWGYDGRGRLRADTSYTGSTARATSYAYDAYERPSTMTDPLGAWTSRYETIRGYADTLLTPFQDTLTYTYDARSRAIGPTIRSSGPLQSRTPKWLVTGELDSLVQKVGTANAGTYARRTLGDSEEGQLPLGPGWLDGSGSGQWVDSLTYDAWERVTSWTRRLAGVVTATETYAHDRNGNVKTGSEVYDTLTDRLLSRMDGGQSRTYVYDRAGNLVGSTRAGVVTTYGYDALNRLVSVRQGSTLIARYAYDVLGRRIAKRVYSNLTGGTAGYARFVYHGDQVSVEADSAGALGLRYTWGMGTDDLVGVRDAAGNQYYAVQDKLGSVRGLYRRDGTWWMRQSFAAYGSLLQRDTSMVGAAVPLRYGWTGREYDAETGWYYFRARYYDPAARRFVQADPAGAAGGDNLYAYVDGQVFNATDPSGMYMMKENPGDDWGGGGSLFAQAEANLNGLIAWGEASYAENLRRRAQKAAATTVVTITYTGGVTVTYTLKTGSKELEEVLSHYTQLLAARASQLAGSRATPYSNAAWSGMPPAVFMFQSEAWRIPGLQSITYSTIALPSGHPVTWDLELQRASDVYSWYGIRYKTPTGYYKGRYTDFGEGVPLTFRAFGIVLYDSGYAFFMAGEHIR
jgi:RHS repeat-associated protein